MRRDWVFYVNITVWAIGVVAAVGAGLFYFNML